MGIRGERVGIVGGSVAGCLAALALHRAGCAVTVFERSGQALRDRGSGIGLPHELRERMLREGWVHAELRSLRFSRRLWLVPDGGDEAGRVIWAQDGLDMSTNNWGVLWRALRAVVPDEVYRPASEVRWIELAGSRPVLHTDSGAEEFDLIVGADGYRSAVRAALHPGTRPGYADYVLWRGNYDADLAPADVREVLDGAAVTPCFPGGHLVAYFVPGHEPGRRTVNWAMYTATPAGFDFTDPTSLAPGDLGGELRARFAELVAEHLPPMWARMVRATPPQRLSMQPIYDLVVDSYVGERALLLGDAAMLARPHTGSGVDKAAGDAFALADLAADGLDWPELLARYDAERRPVGQAIVELGRRLGHAQVQHTPDWANSSAADLRAWATAILAGQPNHMYRDIKDIGDAG